MKRILTALILIPLVLVLVFVGPKWQWLFTLAVALVSTLAAWEFMNMAAKEGARPPRIPVLVAILTLFVGSSQWFQHTAAILGFLCLLLLLYCTFFHSVEQVLPDATVAIFTLIYTGFSMTALPILREETNGPSLVAFLLCTVWAGDSVALYVGSAWGRHKMAPMLSPKKSWEGALGSVAGSLAVTGILLGLASLLQARDIAVLSYPEEPWYWLLLAVVVNVAAQVGDLAESALKRSVGVKDSGTLLPGHGGVLDRIDALLIAAPILWYAQVFHRQIF